MKQIPYGIDDFCRVIRDDYYYIDKSRYIATVEDHGSYIVFVRPRRMGKSMFTNMMMAYYDLANKDRFEELFGGLWIGQHPTKAANSYLVLKFDFSQVAYSRDALAENFTNYCTVCIEDFLLRYKQWFDADERASVLSRKTTKEAINTMVLIAKRKGLRTYLFIDEYDNFSNIVLSARGVKAHEEITHGEGFYRDFFKACKGTFERVYMTGVAPVTYDDLTSGFNIAEVVSLLPAFDKLIGVTETELRDMIEYYRAEGRITRPTDDIVADMKPWYDNFCFAEACYGIEPSIYNTDMVMRYINSLVKSGQPPIEMIDTNARTDTKKLNYLVLTEDLANRELRQQIVKDICARGYTTGSISEQFPASECGNEQNFKSMLYYFGTLTFAGYDNEGDSILRVPNKTMGELYLQYMLQLVKHQGLDLNDLRWHELQECMRQAAINNDWRPMVDMVAQLYSNYSSIRNAIRGEADVQGFLRGLLCLNKYYEVWPELELGGGYCDVLLVPKADKNCPTQYSYLIEIKYMKADQSDIDARITEACGQLDRYVADKHLATSAILRGSTLARLYLVFRGQALAAFGLHR